MILLTAFSNKDGVIYIFAGAGGVVTRERLQKWACQKTLVRSFTKELAGDVNAKCSSVIFTKVDVIRNWVETGMHIIKQQAHPILLET